MSSKIKNLQALSATTAPSQPQEQITKKTIIEKLYIDTPPININKHCDKITNENFVIPCEEDRLFLVTKNYRVPQLKEMCRHYKQKLSGNKEVLKCRVYNFLRLSAHIRIIQNVCKKHFIKKYNMLHGPAGFNRGLCVNDTDFFSLDLVSDISYESFYSYKDVTGKIYGFDIKSILMLFAKPGKSGDLNPYNRAAIPNFVLNEVKKLVKLSKYNVRFSNGGEEINMNNVVTDELTPLQIIKARTLDIFQKMDMLGNYTDAEWFLTLDRPQLIKFVRTMADIWGYRANLQQTTKMEICPPYGDPFRLINLYGISFFNVSTLQRTCLSIMEKMVTTGINDASKYLGSMYVLCALTLVNQNAADSLPWLYDSVIESVP